MDTSVVRTPICEENLKMRLRHHLTSIGFNKTEDGIFILPSNEKDTVRMAHSAQRDDRLVASQHFISERFPTLIKYFASGKDIDTFRISPVLQLISSNTWEGDLFRIAALTWSVPVSRGFGRRLRYLVWDKHNGKLMGIIAIGDPVFNLSVRDKFIDWDAQARRDRLVNIMDAYVLGALPPYNALLGGKTVACLIRSRDMYDDFAKAYGGTTGIISQKEKKACLLAVTTSSSMGRSSIYNRLKLGGTEYFKPIGYTEGWGHFHIPDNMFVDLRDYLRINGHSYADDNRFGQGSNWRLRTIRAALKTLGFNYDILRHGIHREVYICQLADNALKILRGGLGKPDLSSLLSAEEVAHLAVERWMLPRSQRRPEFRIWKRENIAAFLINQQTIPQITAQQIEMLLG